MERIWKWLLHTDARALFLASLALFLAVVGWRGWVDLRPRPAPASTGAAPDRQPLKLEPVRELGLLSLVSNQASPETLVIPVNPFRPTFEAQMLNPPPPPPPPVVKPPDPDPDGNQNTDPFSQLMRNQRSGRGGNRGQRTGPVQQGPKPPPTLQIQGVMQRPDGRYAVLLRDITATSRAAFVAVGESGMDVDVLEADTRLVRLRLPGGEVRELAPGATVQIGAASP